MKPTIFTLRLALQSGTQPAQLTMKHDRADLARGKRSASKSIWRRAAVLSRGRSPVSLKRHLHAAVHGLLIISLLLPNLAAFAAPDPISPIWIAPGEAEGLPPAEAGSLAPDAGSDLLGSPQGEDRSAVPAISPVSESTLGLGAAPGIINAVDPQPGEALYVSPPSAETGVLVAESMPEGPHPWVNFEDFVSDCPKDAWLDGIAGSCTASWTIFNDSNFGLGGYSGYNLRLLANPSSKAVYFSAVTEICRVGIFNAPVSCVLYPLVRGEVFKAQHMLTIPSWERMQMTKTIYWTLDPSIWWVTGRSSRSSCSQKDGFSDGRECALQNGTAAQGHAADPINTQSGVLDYSFDDLGFSTPAMPLTLLRSYSSDLRRPSALGFGWTHNHDSYLIFEDDPLGERDVVWFKAHSANEYAFLDPGDGTYTPTSGVLATLTRQAGPPVTYEIKTQRQERYLFDAAGHLQSWADAEGRAFTLTYDAQGRLAQVTGPSGLRFLQFSYNAQDQVATLADHSGRQVNYSYDAEGNLIAVRDLLGGVWSYSYDSDHRLLSVTDPLGAVALLAEYDSRGRAVRQFNALGDQVVELGFNNDGSTTVTDARGNLTTQIHDGRNTLIKEVDAAGGTITRVYDDNFRVVSLTSAAGHTTRLDWSANGANLTQLTDPLGSTTRLVYDERGNLLSITNANGQISRFTYDGIRLTSAADAMGNTTTYSYTPEGYLAAVNDPLGRTTSHTYDQFGQPLSSTDPAGGVTQIVYDELGRLISTSDPLDRVTMYQYDPAGRLLRLTRNYDPGVPGNHLNQFNIVTEYQYDAVGNQIAIIDSLGRMTRFEYDAAGRLVRTLDALGMETVCEYDPVGNLAAITDPLGRTTRYRYDALNRLIATIDPLGGTSTLAYHPDGTLAAASDPRGSLTRFAYDPLGRLLTVSDPLGRVVHNSYDLAGNLLTVQDPLGAKTSYAYDPLNRVIGITDPLGNLTRPIYDARGNLVARIDPAGMQTHYEYDALDRLTAVVENFDLTPYPGEPANLRTEFAYDAVGNRLAMVDANGHRRRYQYDALDRLTAVIDPLGNITRFGYDPLGSRTDLTDADGDTIRYDYDALGRLLAVNYPAPDVDVSFAYDAAGALTSMRDAVGTTAWVYDDLGRVAGITDPFGEHVGYAYDAAGNRSAVTYPDGRRATYAFDAAGQLTRVTDWTAGVTNFSYDAAGRLLQAVLPNNLTSSYSYDAAGRLLELIHQRPDPQDVGELQLLASYAYRYDRVGNRVQTIETLRGPEEIEPTPTASDTPAPSATPGAPPSATPIASPTPAPSATPVAPTMTSTLAASATPVPPTMTSTPAASATLSAPGVVNLQVKTSADDASAYQRFGAWINGVAEDHIVLMPGRQAGLRFTGVEIPRGATITSAVLELMIDRYGDPAVYLYAQAADNPPDFSAASPRGRAYGKAFVRWQAQGLGDGWQAAPDLTTVIQEVVNRPGWQSGNALVLLAYSAENSMLQSQQWDHAGGPTAARLRVTFTTGSAAVDPGAVRLASAAPLGGSRVARMVAASPLQQPRPGTRPQNVIFAPAGEPPATPFAQISATSLGATAVDFDGREYYTARSGQRGNQAASPAEIGEPRFSPSAAALSSSWVFSDRVASVDTGARYLGSNAGNRWELPLSGDSSPRLARLFVTINHNGPGASSYSVRAAGAELILTQTSPGRAHYAVDITFSGQIEVEMACLTSSSSGASFWLAGALLETAVPLPGGTSTATAPPPTQTRTPTSPSPTSTSTAPPPTSTRTPTSPPPTNTAIASATPSPLPPTSTASVLPSATHTQSAPPSATAPAGGAINTEIAAANDDSYAYLRSGRWVNGVHETSITLVPGFIAGLRFSGLAIPQGAQITGAFVELHVDSHDDPALYFCAEQGSSPPDFAVSSPRERSDAGVYVLWRQTAAGGGWVRSPDLTPIVQEAVNRSGWSGNLVLLMKALPGSLLRFRQWDRDSGASAVRLRVEYLPANLPTPTLPAGPSPTPSSPPPTASATASPQPTATATPVFTLTPSASSTPPLTSTPMFTATPTPLPGVTTVTVDYRYDPLYRLVAADYSSGEFFHYSYDAVGNRLTQSTQAGALSYRYDAADRLLQVGAMPYTWSAAGELLSDGQRSFSYNHAGRLTGVSGPGISAELVYDGLGNRLQATFNGHTTRYTLDLNNRLTQVLAAAGTQYLYGAGRIGEHGVGGWLYHLPDALGSLRQVADPASAVASRRSYEPFGGLLAAPGPAPGTYGFAGEWTDPSGLLHLRARYYDPGNGRFLSVDPFPGLASVPATLHPYQYALNNPVLYVDPSGEIAPWLLAGLIGGAIGAAGGAINYMRSQRGGNLGDIVKDACFWQSVGVGFVGGAVASLVGFAMPTLLPMLGFPSGGGLAAAIGMGVLSGGLSSGISQVTTNLLTGQEWHAGVGRAVGMGALTGGIAGGVGYGIKSLVGAAPIGDVLEEGVIYRGGGTNPGNLTPGAGHQGQLSFRQTLSNPWPLPEGSIPVLRPGKPYFAVDVNRLPYGSVILDNMPPGHVSVINVAVETLKRAIVYTGKFP